MIKIFYSYGQAYKSLVSEVMRGELVSERGGKVQCRRSTPLAFGVESSKARDPFVFIPNRNWGLKIALAEVPWILSGGLGKDFNILEYAPSLSQFKDETDQYFWAQYGTRLLASGMQENDVIPDSRLPVVDQLQYCVDSIELSPDTGLPMNNRRMVMTLWSPQLDTQFGKKDYPCNVLVMFNIRNMKNHALVDITVVRRSNDIVWGIQNNWVQFWSLWQRFIYLLRQRFSLNMDEVTTGIHYEFINNLHWYEKHDYGSKYDKPLEAVKNITCDPAYDIVSCVGYDAVYSTPFNRRFGESSDNGHSSYYVFMQRVLDYVHNNKPLDEIMIEGVFIGTNLANYITRISKEKNERTRKNHVGQRRE